MNMFLEPLKVGVTCWTPRLTSEPLEAVSILGPKGLWSLQNSVSFVPKCAHSAINSTLVQKTRSLP